MTKFKMKKISRAIIVLSFIGFMVFSCGVRFRDPISSPETSECLAGFDTFSQSLLQDGVMQIKYLPLPPWEIAADMPPPPFERTGEKMTVALAEKRNDGKNRIWIERTQSGYYQPNGEFVREEELHEFVIYDVASQEWTSINAYIEGTLVYVDTLFQTSDGAIWGRNIGDENVELEINTVPILSKYNPETTSFEFVKGIIEFPVVSVNPSYLYDWPKIYKYYDEDKFWITSLLDGYIYEYDVNKGILNEFPLPTEVQNGEIVLSNQGKFFISVGGNFRTMDDQIYEYNISNDSLKEIEFPSWVNGATNFYVDSVGNTWLNSLGYKDKNGTWTKLYPIYLQQFYWYQDFWIGRPWDAIPPHPFFESTDGRLWFRVGREYESGMAWYDPVTEESCWFATVWEDLVEDSNKNLWLVSDRKLYKLDLSD